MLTELRDRLQAEGTLTLTLRIRPQARQTEYKGTLADGCIKIDVRAVPEDGEANAELIRYLAEEFSVPRSSVVLLSGQVSRQKIVRIAK